MNFVRARDHAPLPCLPSKLISTKPIPGFDNYIYKKRHLVRELVISIALQSRARSQLKGDHSFDILIPNGSKAHAIVESSRLQIDGKIFLCSGYLLNSWHVLANMIV